MTKTAFNRDNILTPEERAVSARKCLKLLDDDTNCTDDMRANDYSFYVTQREKAKRTDYAPSERELTWLRDLVEKYVQ